MYSKNIKIKFQKSDSNKDVLLITTRFWGDENNTIPNTFTHKFSVLDLYSVKELELYLYLKQICNLIQFIILKHNYKKVIFMGICKDTHFQAKVIQKIHLETIFTQYHMIGLPLMLNMNDDSVLKYISPQMHKSYHKDLRFKQVFSNLNIFDILKDVTTVTLHPVICNNNEIDINIYKDNLDKDGNQLVPMEKTLEYIDSYYKDKTYKHEHMFYYYICTKNPTLFTKELDNKIQEILDYV